MNFSAYQGKALEFLNPEIPKDELINLVMLGLNGEAGQAADYWKKIKYHGHQMDKDKIIHELGDVLWYLAIGAHALGISLDDIAFENIKKLSLRYPNGWDNNRSINRET